MFKVAALARTLREPWIIYGAYSLYRRYLRPRLYRAAGLYALRRVGRAGVGCRFQGPVTLAHPANLTLGDYVRIGEGSFLFCLGGLEIGTNTQISRNVSIYTANHDTDGDMLPYGEGYECRPVHVGRSVWIGRNACILPGVTIGDGAVIGMGTTVSKDVPAGAVVVGAPQRVVGQRDMARLASMDEQKLYFGRINLDGRWAD